MEKDWGNEIDRINAELGQIKKILTRSGVTRFEPSNPVEDKDILSSEGRAELITLRNLLISFADETHQSGGAAYAGSFETHGRQSTWAMTVQTDLLLSLNNQQMTEKVLASIGNSQRLAILLALLKQPMTVAQLVESLGAITTGLIYYHLKPLLLADLLDEEKGVYTVKPHRIPGIIMLLVGVWDLEGQTK